MALSHINPDAPGTPPWPNDRCLCESREKTGRCCGLDHSRFRPLRGGVRVSLTEEERSELRELSCDQREQVDQALEILERRRALG